MDNGEHRGFGGNEVTLCDAIRADSWSHTCIKIHKCAALRVNPSVKCGLWVDFAFKTKVY